MKQNDFTVYPQIKKKLFHKLIFTWFDEYGRKHLPWQQDKTPYRVWISEIMLQQTQVTTVIPYYERFMKKFPNVISLANAKLDDVLHLWTGLGYYTRARNLHRSANMIKENFKGKFPDTLEELQQLPGIGRSTAGAILSIAFQERATILDGNIKRVLTRVYGIKEWPGEKKTVEQLWKIAEDLTPELRTADYSQAMMDLGATICTRSKPVCSLCPLKKHCVAHQLGMEKVIPQSKPKKVLPIRYATLLFIQYEDTVLLNKRPTTGIWGGLWSPLEIVGHHKINYIKNYCSTQLLIKAKTVLLNESFRHTFSHFHLEILPAHVLVNKKVKSFKIMDTDNQIWYKLQDSQQLGLSAPVKKILRKLYESHG